MWPAAAAEHHHSLAPHFPIPRYLGFVIIMICPTLDTLLAHSVASADKIIMKCGLFITRILILLGRRAATTNLLIPSVDHHPATPSSASTVL